jgi:AGCS family alanine or glycine:cation symporter
MDFQLFLKDLSQALIGWPLFIFVIAVAVMCTVAFKFIQFRYFIYAWKQILFPSKAQTTESSSDMTPIQAFINTLSSNLGNGTIAGVASGIYSGGPGAVIWLALFGIALMSIRFAEAFLSMHYGALAPAASKLGGPMLYLREVFAGPTLAWIYGILCFGFCLVGGNSVQTNSIALSFQRTFGIAPLISAVFLTFLILYIVGGGAARIVKISVAMVPIKIVVFFSTTIIVLVYHYKSLLPALMLMGKSAFAPQAVIGGLVGFTVTQAIAAGMMRQIFATESGLGTAGILFGSSGSKAPMKDAIVAMLSTFISTVFCFIVGLCIVASGVWNTGFTSTALTIEAFNTVFGSLGGYAVTFLSVTFGVGVLIAYAYITREVWLSLTGGRYAFIFPVLYCVFAFGGALIDTTLLWSIGDIPQAFMLAINLFGIVYLLPIIRKNVIAFMQTNK